MYYLLGYVYLYSVISTPTCFYSLYFNIFHKNIKKIKKGDRMLQFLLPFILSQLYPRSFLPSSILAFSENIVCAFFGTIVGSWVDKSPRLSCNFSNFYFFISY